ncbi:hypothetical protein ABZ896_09235 [Streptomyces sp. NPDC047072]|uniref:hypothetical protein n=1 Tax=Streptomyces sp. NPDC047072 TaxID=3154809 RepID=UPI0033F4A025
MLAKYHKGDLLSIPVTEGRIAMAQIVEKLGGNVLLAVYPELLDATAPGDLASVELDEPIFLVETMDQNIRERVWPVAGNREVPRDIKVPVYKVWVEPPGEYRVQHIDGTLGAPLSPEEASRMKHQKSYSPAVVEAALRGFHGHGPWHRTYDELTV